MALYRITEWIVTDDATWRKTPEVRRDEIRSWLAMNGINPLRIPLYSTVSVRECADRTWEICYLECAVTKDGRIKFDESEPYGVKTHPMTTPLEINPPMYLLRPVTEKY